MIVPPGGIGACRRSGLAGPDRWPILPVPAPLYRGSGRSLFHVSGSNFAIGLESTLRSGFFREPDSTVHARGRAVTVLPARPSGPRSGQSGVRHGGRERAAASHRVPGRCRSRAVPHTAPDSGPNVRKRKQHTSDASRSRAAPHTAPGFRAPRADAQAAHVQRRAAGTPPRRTPHARSSGRGGVWGGRREAAPLSRQRPGRRRPGTPPHPAPARTNARPTVGRSDGRRRCRQHAREACALPGVDPKVEGSGYASRSSSLRTWSSRCMSCIARAVSV